MRSPRIVEIYGPVIQGEGPVIGHPTVFVRTGGCDLRCSWCDTMFAVDPKHAKDWTFMSSADVLDRIYELTKGLPFSVTFSGGNPCLQPLGEIIDVLEARGVPTIIETQGTIIPEWIEKPSQIVISPKPPSAGQPFEMAQLRAFVENRSPHAMALKIVVGTRDDFGFAREVFGEFPKLPAFVQSLNPTPRSNVLTAGDLLKGYRTLTDWVLEAGMFNVRVLPQLHALAWGNERGR